MSAAKRFLPTFVNRNPRNLEATRVQRRQTGWAFEKDREKKNFFYKAVLLTSKNHTDAHIVHIENGVVLTASTREPLVSQQLHSNVDTSAAHNIGRILADRCQQSGIQACIAATDAAEVARSERKQAFYTALEAGGISLAEPTPVEHSHENDPKFTWQRFPIKHTREDKLDEDPVIRK
uniref:Large ribosomal subunit protein uL18m n=1 Tax=Panagrellus redivivus TaxID=6233 RepID=A0A7E4VEB6_PANRE